MKTGILLYHHFSEYELSVTLSVLKQGNQEIETIGLNEDQVVGEAGLICVPTSTIKQVDVNELNCLVLPGCDDIGHLKDEIQLFSFIRQVIECNSVVAAISSAPFLLAKAGALHTHRYTVGFTREQRDLIGVFDEANYIDAPLVTDGKMLTAKGAYFIDFGIRLGKMLELDFDSNWYR
ncbi:hypothetical protein J8TS2_12920 [Lederbergia ruris]|uniref:DJ-1/PfpI domain-containing protein n=1 Tax=Lederbergia ruris TaxID=217495 RepID=A0ABQ4KG77_9BACI|nr:DJ-1/PfpI family protein [Lederbergia ruris]GIN56973.1 hypothetical protein J8TS2_12920 [Lederbergia ruris]